MNTLQLHKYEEALACMFIETGMLNFHRPGHPHTGEAVVTAFWKYEELPHYTIVTL